MNAITSKPALYEAVFAELAANPKLKAATVCKERNVSYSGYRYWFKKRKAQTSALKSPKVIVPDPVDNEPGTVTISVNMKLSDIALAFMEGDSEMSLPVREVLDQLSKDDSKAFVALLSTAKSNKAVTSATTPTAA